VLGFLVEQHGTGGVFGLEIIKATDFRGGTVYPILAELEKLGWVVGEWEDAELAAEQRRPRRRYYRLTGEGLVEAREYLAPRSLGAHRVQLPGAPA
jgi:DNA-binding PadR family transcriptional regulator